MGQFEGAVPTETGSSQSGSGWCECSGIPPSTCEAANAAPQAIPQETRFRQQPDSGLLRELHHHYDRGGQASARWRDRVRKRAFPGRAPTPARVRRTAILSSWYSPAVCDRRRVRGDKDTPAARMGGPRETGRAVSFSARRGSGKPGRRAARIPVLHGTGRSRSPGPTFHPEGANEASSRGSGKRIRLRRNQLPNPWHPELAGSLYLPSFSSLFGG